MLVDSPATGRPRSQSPADDRLPGDDVHGQHAAATREQRAQQVVGQHRGLDDEAHPGGGEQPGRVDHHGFGPEADGTTGDVEVPGEPYPTVLADGGGGQGETGLDLVAGQERDAEVTGRRGGDGRLPGARAPAHRDHHRPLPH
nr:hypothetical protein [Micromonospora haikouensis]